MERILSILHWPIWSEKKKMILPDAGILSPNVLNAALPPKQREAVMLIHVEGLTVQEASRRAGVTKAALKVRAHRGYRALRKALRGAGI